MAKPCSQNVAKTCCPLGTCLADSKFFIYVSIHWSVYIVVKCLFSFQLSQAWPIDSAIYVMQVMVVKNFIPDSSDLLIKFKYNLMYVISGVYLQIASIIN